MKFIQVAALGTVLLAGNALAVECPSVSALKGEGLTMAQMVFPYMYLDYHISKYGTEDIWLFGLGPVEAQDSEEALDKGNALLTKLSGDPDPEKDQEGAITCTYSLGEKDEYMAVAFLSLDSVNPHINSYFHK